MTDLSREIEALARQACLARGEDPDEEVPHGPFLHHPGMDDSRAYRPRWVGLKEWAEPFALYEAVLKASPKHSKPRRLAMPKQLAAFTPNSMNYPPFVNLSEEDGTVTITVRESRHDNGECGRTVDMSLPRADAVTLLREALSELEGEAR